MNTVNLSRSPAAGDLIPCPETRLDGFAWPATNVRDGFGRLLVAAIGAALVVGLLLLWAMPASCQPYEVQGIVSFESDRAPHEPLVSFTLTVNGRAWFVRTTTPDKRLSDYEEAYFDGTNVFHLSSMATAVKNMRANGEEAGANVANAAVDNTAFLHSAFAHYIAPACFAYASGAYLDGVTDQMVEPIWYWPLSTGVYSLENRVTVKAQVERHPTAPRLPTRVVFFDEGLKRHPSWKSAKPVRRQPPYDRGFTNAIYSAGTFTNLGGVALPTSAVLEVFAPKDEVFSQQQPGTNPSDLLSHSRYRITLTNATLRVTQALTPPKFPGVTYVSDSRFVGEAGVGTYFSATNFLGPEHFTNSVHRRASTQRPGK